MVLAARECECHEFTVHVSVARTTARGTVRFPYFVTRSVVENEQTSPASSDSPPWGGLRTLLRAALVLALVFGVGAGAWTGWRHVRRGVCEQRSQTDYHVAYKNERLVLREISRDVEGVPGEDREWGELRPRLDDHRREWIELRTRACVERHSAAARCLDDQAAALSGRVHSWVAGDPSWGTSELDDAIPSPLRCLAGSP